MPAHPETAAKATELAAAVQLDVTHSHDDLLFTKHNLFLLMTHDAHPGVVSLFFNETAPKDEAAALHATLLQEAEGLGISLSLRGMYRTNQSKDEAFSLELLPN